ncbi:MAG: prepilin-type N-terminal cleavage/methylation domain-containing protein [Lachnospiraceae bacterium]|nr:prepilin-type N-terminal cleavage/methylation domain-containing protein [Lachnospiraceae bacterium]
MKNTKKMNNKGFSLVELIIVVAIMALLVGVLAPTYLKYVEKSRISADASTVDQIVGAMEILAADVDKTLDSSKEYTVTTTAGSDEVKLSAELKSQLETYGINTDTYKVTSTKYKDAAFTLKLKWSTDHWEIDGVTGIPS